MLELDATEPAAGRDVGAAAVLADVDNFVARQFLPIPRTFDADACEVRV